MPPLHVALTPGHNIEAARELDFIKRLCRPQEVATESDLSIPNRHASPLAAASRRIVGTARWIPARYIRHQGEKPMAITWELTHAMPGDLYASFAAAVG